MSEVVFSAGDMERLERDKDPRSDEIQNKLADICTEYDLPIVACLVPEKNGFRGVMAGSKGPTHGAQWNGYDVPSTWIL